MSGKQLGDSGVSLVAQKLQSGHHYSALFLSKNHIGDSGLQVLASALKKDTQVQHLILSHNKITNFAMSQNYSLSKTSIFYRYKSKLTWNNLFKITWSNH